ncbi:MAG: sensor histidine kinase [Candidatus Glassbacteria bacterium]
MIQKQERILYARVFSNVLEGDPKQLKLASLLGYRLMRRGVSLDKILELHSEAFNNYLSMGEMVEKDFSRINLLATNLLRTILNSYWEAYRDVISSLREESKELKMRASSLEAEIEEQTADLRRSREELVQKVEEITKDQAAMLIMIEDLNRINRELSSTREKLKSSEKLAILGKLSLSLSHELRNPLGVIENCASILETKIGEKKDDVNKWTGRIKDQVRRCNRIIESVLGFDMHDFKSNDLFSATEAIRKAVMRCPASESVSIKSLTRKPVFVKGDEEQITQAIYNLIINGLESIRDEGKVAVTLRLLQTGNGGNQNLAEITVTDTGEGVCEERINLIFEPFYSTKAGRVGLGLPLCRSIVGKHGGTVSLKSGRAGETCFAITLPIEKGFNSDIQ